jgi:hypothetical protein
VSGSFRTDRGLIFDRQASAPLGTPTIDNGPSPLGGHPFSKAVVSRTPDPTGLIGSFHGSCLYLFRKINAWLPIKKISRKTDSGSIETITVVKNHIARSLSIYCFFRPPCGFRPLSL